MGWKLSGPGGKNPQERILQIKKDVMPTEGDALYAGQLQRSRILERTSRGIDVDGAAFAPYSTKGPFYYSPNGKLTAGAKSQLGDKKQRESTRRFLNKITTKEERAGGNAPRLSRTGRSIVFASYAAFKKWLGRSGVDLRGPSAPHMLQGFLVKVASAIYPGPPSVAVGLRDKPTQVTEMRLGIYGDAARRATGNNSGEGNAKRHFFGVSAQDGRLLIQSIMQRIKLRLKGN
jgi:hypothetical protein